MFSCSSFRTTSPDSMTGALQADPPHQFAKPGMRAQAVEAGVYVRLVVYQLLLSSLLERTPQADPLSELIRQAALLTRISATSPAASMSLRTRSMVTF